MTAKADIMKHGLELMVHIAQNFKMYLNYMIYVVHFNMLFKCHIILITYFHALLIS